MLGTAGDEDAAVAQHAGDQAADRTTDMALRVDVGVVEHGVARAAHLAAAVRLSCRGYHVEVFEKLDAPGGRAYVWRQDGFTFDAGPTIVTAPFMLEELWALCGRKFSDDIDLRALDPFYRFRFDDGSWFDYSGDADHMRAEVARFCPDDLPGYERLAVMLGRQPARVASYRRYLDEHGRQSPLFDVPQIVRDIEAHFERLALQHRAQG